MTGYSLDISIKYKWCRFILLPTILFDENDLSREYFGTYHPEQAAKRVHQLGKKQNFQVHAKTSHSTRYSFVLNFPFKEIIIHPKILFSEFLVLIRLN